jgi:hypothetical protein
MKPPILSPLDVLTQGYKYVTEGSNLSYGGAKVEYVGQGASAKNCIPAFTDLTFGVKTDEPAQCKIGLQRTPSFSDMPSYMAEGSAYTYNHTITLPSSAFPSSYALNQSNLSLDLGQNENFYVRCEDRNGNANPADYVVNFCVDDGPDTTAPTISTNYGNTSYITHGVQYADDVNVYTNEPATCRWSRNDVDYARMENNMTGCSMKLGDYTFPSSYQYGCHANLTGIKDGTTNNYFIRCEDKPGLDPANSKERRIANQQSYKLSLIGTNQLAIDDISINGESSGSTFKDSTSPVDLRLSVKTSAGAEANGNARCSYNPAGDNLYYEFYNDGNFGYNYKNVHDLYLESGTYNYNIKCCDIANNCDTQPINFTVNVDTTPPQISRAYYEAGQMKLVTDEKSDCVYSTDTCNYLFADGLKFKTNDNIDHFTPWDTTSDLYVKCKDQYGNLPAPDECSMIVRAYTEFTSANVTK